MHNLCAAEPQTLRQFVKETTINGDIRSYYFTRNYGNPAQTNQAAFSLGGALNILSAPILSHFKVGGSYYAADPLGLNSSNFNQVDATLPGDTVNVLGQAFLQYQKSNWLLRGGEQWLDTPWLNAADMRMIPATYNGLYTEFHPINALKMSAFRIFRYKSRTSKEFNATNLYNPNNYGGTPIPQMLGVDTLGALAGGAEYRINDLKTQLWFYKFYDFANLAYTDVSYNFPVVKMIKPFISLQLAKEWGDGKNELQQFGYGKTNAAVYGAMFGFAGEEGRVDISYDAMPHQSGAYQNGDIISPYTTGYAYDPLYTTSMDGGLIEKSSGQAVKVSGHYYLLDQRLRLALSYARYYTLPVTANTNEVDLDILYILQHTLLKGLSLRERLGLLNGNPADGRFLYNRLMLQYDF